MNGNDDDDSKVDAYSLATRSDQQLPHHSENQLETPLLVPSSSSDNTAPTSTAAEGCYGSTTTANEISIPASSSSSSSSSLDQQKHKTTSLSSSSSFQRLVTKIDEFEQKRLRLKVPIDNFCEFFQSEIIDNDLTLYMVVSSFAMFACVAAIADCAVADRSDIALGILGGTSLVMLYFFTKFTIAPIIFSCQMYGNESYALLVHDCYSWNKIQSKEFAQLLEGSFNEAKNGKEIENIINFLRFERSSLCRNQYQKMKTSGVLDAFLKKLLEEEQNNHQLSVDPKVILEFLKWFCTPLPVAPLRLSPTSHYPPCEDRESMIKCRRIDLAGTDTSSSTLQSEQRRALTEKEVEERAFPKCYASMKKGKELYHLLIERIAPQLIGTDDVASLDLLLNLMNDLVSVVGTFKPKDVLLDLATHPNEQEPSRFYFHFSTPETYNLYVKTFHEMKSSDSLTANPQFLKNWVRFCSAFMTQPFIILPSNPNLRRQQSSSPLLHNIQQQQNEAALGNFVRKRIIEIFAKQELLDLFLEAGRRGAGSDENAKMFNEGTKFLTTYIVNDSRVNATIPINSSPMSPSSSIPMPSTSPLPAVVVAAASSSTNVTSPPSAEPKKESPPQIISTQQQHEKEVATIFTSSSSQPSPPHDATAPSSSDPFTLRDFTVYIEGLLKKQNAKSPSTTPVSLRSGTIQLLFDNDVTPENFLQVKVKDLDTMKMPVMSRNVILSLIESERARLKRKNAANEEGKPSNDDEKEATNGDDDEEEQLENEDQQKFSKLPESTKEKLVELESMTSTSTLVVYRPWDVVKAGDAFASLGQGSFGSVFEAELVPRRNQKCAAKTCDSTTGKKEVENFMKLSAGGAGCRNIVDLFGVTTATSNAETIVLVLELAKEDFSKLLLRTISSSSSPLSPSQILQFSKDIATGLAFLHQKKIVHCDLKPSNILVFEDNDENDENEPNQQIILKLTDFHGLVEMRGSRTTLRTNIVGTEDYLPPEHTLSDREGVRSPANPSFDIFSFGIILLQMLTLKTKTYTTVFKNQIQERILEFVSSQDEDRINELSEESCIVLEEDVEMSEMFDMPNGDDEKEKDLVLELIVLCQDCLMMSKEKRPQNGSELLKKLSEIDACDKNSE